MIEIETFNKTVLTKKEFADFMSVSIRTVDNWLQKGMPVIRVGSVLRFDPAMCLMWMDDYTKEKESKKQ